MCTMEQLQESIDRLEKTLIESRDKNHTVSEIMLSFQEKLDAHAQDNEKSFKRIEKKLETSMKRIEPALNIITTAKGTRKGIIWIAGFVASLGVIMEAFHRLREWLK